MTDETQKEETIQDLKMKLAIGQSEKRVFDSADERYAKKIIERIVFGVIVIFALAALFFIFTKVGLPTPTP